jgi:hypothetical protein
MLSTNLWQLLVKSFFANPLYLNGKTATIGATAQTVGTGLKDITSGGTYTAEVDHVYTLVMQATAYVIGGTSQTTGAGLSDVTSGGVYVPAAGPSANHTYKVKISTADATDKFQWSVDGGAYSAEIAITGAAQTLEKGVTVAFNAATGHVLHDEWTFTITGTDAYKFKTDAGALGGNTPVTGAAQTLANGVTATFAAIVGHTPGDTFTITVTGGVRVATAEALNKIKILTVGTVAELRVYDGKDSSGNLLYDGKTADWTANETIDLGFLLQNAEGLYVELYDTGAYPQLIVGYN